METIFALSTAPGKSGVAIIRVSGLLALNALAALGCEVPAPRYAALKKLFDPQTTEVIDEAMILWFKAPNSFTGEEVVEIHTHGSKVVIQSVLEVLSSLAGFRIAEPGEFALRGFLNGKMDLTQAEGIADLIDAETKSQQKQAIRQMNGELARLYEQWRKQIITALGLLEAYIDFPDEDLPSEIIFELESIVKCLISDIESHLNDGRKGEKLRSGLYTVIIGAPNVGKSSLLNLLAKRDVAIVSGYAGTTRDVIEVHMDIGGYPVIVADTAGIRESEDEVENEGIRRAKARASQADCKLILFDAAALPEIDQTTQLMIDERAIVVFNKVDMLQATAQIPQFSNAYRNLSLSVKNGDGVSELLSILENFAAQELNPGNEPLITRVRHRNNLEACRKALMEFSLNKEIELAAEDLRQAAMYLGKITGKIDVDEILDEIFSKFCIGK